MAQPLDEPRPGGVDAIQLLEGIQAVGMDGGPGLERPLVVRQLEHVVVGRVERHDGRVDATVRMNEVIEAQQDAPSQAARVGVQSLEPLDVLLVGRLAVFRTRGCQEHVELQALVHVELPAHALVDRAARALAPVAEHVAVHVPHARPVDALEQLSEPGLQIRRGLTWRRNAQQMRHGDASGHQPCRREAYRAQGPPPRDQGPALAAHLAPAQATTDPPIRDRPSAVVAPIGHVSRPARRAPACPSPRP